MDNRKRSWFVFSLRSAGVVLTIALVALGYWANRSLRQQRAVQSILSRGGRIQYASEDPTLISMGATPKEPSWLAKRLGRDFVESVAVAEFIGRKFADDDLKLLDDLPKVNWLRIYDTNVSGSEFAHVARLKHLKSLLVNDSPLTDDALVEIGKLRQLELLYLVGTKVTDRGAVHVSRLDRLTMLSLSGCPITDAALADSLAESLVQLSLENTGIGDASIKRLAQLDKLEQLSLYGTQVTDDGLPALQGMGSLKSLMLGDTKVTNAGLLQLQTRRPDLYISPSPTGER